MRLIVIAGFLGAGKTSLLLCIARSQVKAGRQVVIIENEVGEIGIDDLYLKRQGLRVREVYSGCVCCQLSSDLVSTLQEIKEVLAPDIVILEASGVAEPGRLIEVVDRYAKSVSARELWVLLDAPRYQELRAILAPFVTSSIQAADVVVINKVDEVDTDMVVAIKEDVVVLRPNVPTHAISALNEIGLEPLVARL